MNFSTVKADRLVFGYRIFKVQNMELAASLLLGAGVNADISADGELIVRLRDEKKVRELFGGRVRFEAGNKKGLLGRLSSLKNKCGLAVGAFIALLLCLFLSSRVWDIRVEGNLAIPDSVIREMLEDSGLSVGSGLFRLDTAGIENTLLQNYPQISWINLNRRGTVVYASVAESVKDTGEEEAEGLRFANIVATSDCIIEEITVKRGTATVKVGDTVRKGEILILGILPDASGGGLCRAEGTVVGRVSDSVVVETEREYTEMIPEKDKLISLSVKIFEKNINIFKNYGNCDEFCDIIKEIKTYALFGGAQLPLSVSAEYQRSYKESSASYSDTELTAVCRQRMDRLISERLVASDLIGIKSDGRFTEKGYLLESRLVFLTDVGERVDFE